LAPGTGGVTGYTNSLNVSLQLKAVDTCPTITAELSNNGTTFTPNAATLVSGSATATWTVPSGEGTKTIYARFRDGAGNVSGVYSTQIILDTIPPTTPSTLVKSSCNISGSTRTVSMSWGGSTDTNFSAYRVYQQLNGGTWTAVATPSGTTYTDNPPGTRKQDTVGYKIRAYDKAGNESGDTNVITAAAQKNNPC
jgi:hypothetical protein